jgi:hypothetical protein
LLTYGRIITTILVVFLAPLTYLFAFVCNDISGCPAPSLLHPQKLFTAPLLSTKSGWQHGTDVLKQEVGWPGWTGLINIEATIATLGWYGLSVALWALLPAYEIEGTELRTGGRLKYRMNGRSDTGSTAASIANEDISALLLRLDHTLLRRWNLDIRC